MLRTLLLGLAVALALAATADPVSSQCPGTQGTNGVPRLAIDKPSLGSTMDIDIYRGRPGGFYVLAVTVGGSPAPTPLGTICVDLSWPIVITSGVLDLNGEATLRLPIFNLTMLLNIPVNAQAAILDSANPTGYALTNGVATRVTAPYGYISGWNRNTGGWVERVDLTSANTIDTVQVGGRPVSVATPGRAGRYAFCGSYDGSLYLIDYGTTPPSVRSLPIASSPVYGVGVTRDGRFCYASNYGTSSTAGTTTVVDADPLSATFFTVLGKVAGYPPDHVEIEETKASPDRRFVCNAVFGFGSGRAQLSKVDADPHRSSFNTMIATVPLTGGWAGDLAIRPGNGYAYVALFSLSAQAQIAVVDTVNMVSVDFDPVAPGCQNLGGEITVPRTNVGNNPKGMAVDETGRHVYIADTISQTTPPVYQAHQLDVLPSSSTYHQVTRSFNMPIATQTWEVGVTPGDDRIIMVYNSSPNATIIDTTTGAVIKHLNLTYSTYGIAVR
jgi:DNA-binding beta-propeller fold protein YncE